MSQQRQDEYNAFKNSIQRLSDKIQELTAEAEEHAVVIDTLKTVDGSRRCMRMNGAVLLDQTVDKAMPSLQETKDGLDKAVKTLKTDLEKTQKELEAWKVKYNVKIVSN